LSQRQALALASTQPRAFFLLYPMQLSTELNNASWKIEGLW
jgi:hypothetical protein